MKATAIVLAAGAAFAAEQPEVSNVSMQPQTDRSVKIEYTLAKAPAIVTVDIQTNGVSIGGENVRFLSGEVNKLVEANGAHTIMWDARRSWPEKKIDEEIVTAVVTAHSPDTPPDYIAVDLVNTATVRYYPEEGQVPGGVNSSPNKDSVLVLRKISAKGKTFSLGSSGANVQIGRQDPYSVTLDHDYYIGVFPITQGQWARMLGKNPATYTAEGTMRPIETVSTLDIRMNASDAEDTSCEYPNAPHSSSFLGKLRSHSGLAFDVPSEAEWEIAALAGHGEGYYGDGTWIAWDTSTLESEGLNNLGRYIRNGGKVLNASGNYVNPAKTVGPEHASPIVGSYAPNDFGIYDILGTVWECTLDWQCSTRSGNTNGDPLWTKEHKSSDKHIYKGGGWDSEANICFPVARVYRTIDAGWNSMGLRVALRIGE